MQQAQWSTLPHIEQEEHLLIPTQAKLDDNQQFENIKAEAAIIK